MSLREKFKDSMWELAIFVILPLAISVSAYFIYSSYVANQVIVFYSKPFAEKISPTEYLVTVRVEVVTQYTNSIYVVPFLANTSRLPALTLQEGFVNEVLDPSIVGYVNVTGQNVEDEVLYGKTFDTPNVTSFATINAFAFNVPTSEPFNVTFVTNGSYVPVVWIAVQSPYFTSSLYVPKEIVVPINGTPYLTTP